jgi:hypothetical protein
MMKKAIPPPLSATSIQDWKRLFDEAIVEEDPKMFPARIQTARDAIVDKIEDSFDTASSSDRLLLLAALNTISGLFEDGRGRSRIKTLGHFA